MIILSKNKKILSNFGVGCTLSVYFETHGGAYKSPYELLMLFAEPSDECGSLLGTYSSEEEAQKDLMRILEALKNHDEFIEL